MITIKVPNKFWDDHHLRFSDDGIAVGVEVGRNKVWSTVEFTDEALDNLISDCDYYAQPDLRREWQRDEDTHLVGLSESAERCLKAIARQVEPTQVEADPYLRQWAVPN